jgi:anti-sigma B factor antagonist
LKTVDAKISGSCLELTVKTPRLDAATAGEFKKECAELWPRSVATVCADLGVVDFIDSSGVGALLGLFRKLPPETPALKLRNVRPQVQSVVELLRLHRIFEVES